MKRVSLVLKHKHVFKDAYIKSNIVKVKVIVLQMNKVVKEIDVHIIMLLHKNVYKHVNMEHSLKEQHVLHHVVK